LTTNQRIVFEDVSPNGLKIRSAPYRARAPRPEFV